MVYMLFSFFQADDDNFSIFLTLLRYRKPLMSPSMMEGLILGLFCLRKSCVEDLSERVSGVVHLSIPGVIFLKTGLQSFAENPVRKQMEHNILGATEHL